MGAKRGSVHPDHENVGFGVQMKNSIAVKMKITHTVRHSPGVTKS